MKFVARSVRFLRACAPGLLALSGCDGLAPPDPYLGTIDSTGFDALYRGGTTGCLSPRRGYGGASGMEAVSWIYLGALSQTQVDVLNLADPLRAAPPPVYQVSGCAPIEETFDPRTQNFVRTVQYPILGNGEPEPTTPASYRPWHALVPVSIRDNPKPKPACNDVKSQRSIEDRAGWDRDNKVFGKGDFDPKTLAGYPYGFVLPDGDWAKGLDLKPNPPSADQIRSGMVPILDMPMVHLGMPIQKTADARTSCPFATGSTTRYPRFPGDPEATFQFPEGAWLRGLLSGYLDGGEVPLNRTDPSKCPAMIQTTKSCSAMMPCDAGGVCVSGRCRSRLPICPVFNDVYVPQNEVASLNTGTVMLMDGGMTRTAEVLAIFAKTPGQTGFSPICRLRAYDPAKVTCGRKEPETIAPRPLCTADEIDKSPGAVSTAEAYVHCLFPMPKK